MNIAHLDSGHSLASTESRPRRREHRVGEQLRLSVLQRLDSTRYQVGFPEGWRVVNSTVPLPVGGTIRATVTAVGEQLELQYQGSDVVAASMAQHESNSEDALAEYEQRFKVSLSDSDKVILQESMSTAQDTQAMLMSGLFLGKLSLSMDDQSLDAVYRAQRWPDAAVHGSLATHRLDHGNDVEQLTNAVQSTLLEPPVSPATVALHAPRNSIDSSADGDTDREQRERAWQLLNDQDGGSVEYRYGVLPVIVADQLFELDLVYFRERQSSAEPAANSKRMVMTLNAPALGRVEVVAHALGERVSVTIKTQSNASKEILSAEHERVREVLERLGWGVDAVRYEVEGIDTRASARIVEHVLNGDSLSRWA
jgi:hypothetical protein